MGRRKKKKTIKFNNYLAFVLVIISLLTLGLVYLIDVLPLNYFSVFCLVVIFFNIMLIWLLKVNGKVRNVLGILGSIVLIIIETLGISYEFKTLDFLKQFGFNNYKTENYYVVVLKNSSYQNIKDLEKQKIGHLANRDSINKALTKIKKEINFTDQIFTSTEEELASLINHDIAAFLIEEAELNILKEENVEKANLITTIYSSSVEVAIQNVMKEVDVTKDAFNVYISGIDTYGKITQVSRSDVNIIASVNPKTKQIILTSIPRDYYVTLANYNAKDKLTHAGIYGIETSIATLEQLLDIKINYYIKVNFTSLIKIVDALDGITVNSKYSFTSKDGYTYTKGLNNLNGQEALSFVRERKAFKEGDRMRGVNQQAVLTAIINKALEPNIIINYNDLLDAVSGAFITNINEESITKMIKKELKEPSKWQITSINLNGTDSYDYTYSYQKTKLYVMEPDLESVENASDQIKKLLKEN